MNGPIALIIILYFIFVAVNLLYHTDGGDDILTNHIMARSVFWPIHFIKWLCRALMYSVTSDIRWLK